MGSDSVRLGITAPPNVAVHRREVFDQIRAANAAAAVEAAPALVDRLRQQMEAALRRG